MAFLKQARYFRFLAFVLGGYSRSACVAVLQHLAIATEKE